MAPTKPLFLDDGYLQACTAQVISFGDGKLICDQTVFYPTGGGQAGDHGSVRMATGLTARIIDTCKHKTSDGALTGAIVHIIHPDDVSALALHVAPGSSVHLQIDWMRRYAHMRYHTASHLMCYLTAQLVNGCSITADYARIDFGTDAQFDKEALNAGLARLIEQALPVVVGSVTDEQLDQNPGLCKSMSVQPPRGGGSVRTIAIGHENLVDLQPCGGTHVRNTSEIGPISVVRVEKKGALSRRVVLQFIAD